MKRFLFGLLLSLIGHSYSLFCFIWAVKEPWIHRGFDGIIGSMLGHEVLAHFLLFTLLMLFGLTICLVEAYRRK